MGGWVGPPGQGGAPSPSRAAVGTCGALRSVVLAGWSWVGVAFDWLCRWRTTVPANPSPIWGVRLS